MQAWGCCEEVKMEETGGFLGRLETHKGLTAYKETIARVWASLHELVKRLVICTEDFIFINEAHHVQPINNLDSVTFREELCHYIPRIPPLANFLRTLVELSYSAQRVKGQGKYRTHYAFLISYANSPCPQENFLFSSPLFGKQPT